MRTNGAFAWILATSLLQLASSSALTDNHVPPITIQDTHSSTTSSPAPSSIVSSTSVPTAPATPQTTPAPHTTSNPTPKSASPFLTPSTCPSRTVNYLTHTLPQQCHKTSRVPLAEAAEVKDNAYEGPWALSQLLGGTILAYRTPTTSKQVESTVLNQPTTTPEPPKSPESISKPIIVESVAETDSPLDDTNFLSFEEWKRQNLARAGQSLENVGAGRQAPEGRKRPGINNALDSLGEDAEIDLDFGFGSPETREVERWKTDPSSTKGKERPSDGAEVPISLGRSKDAGKTCKERFNYASFDCAANILKTNAQSKSSSSVLVENKDSYMLNECKAQNKFIIVELCEDILVDTVVLANYEFFSSMFRTFRVSVSDRFPVKMEGWKVLGTFEARNSRDIQAFLVEQPLIWARYLRVEFLTQYGSEYYCPVSLLRVHGTTMMEEYKNEENLARGDFYEEPIEEAAQGGVISGVPPVYVPPEPSPLVIKSTAEEISSLQVESTSSTSTNSVEAPTTAETSHPTTRTDDGTWASSQASPSYSNETHTTSKDQEFTKAQPSSSSDSLVYVDGTLALASSRSGTEKSGSTSTKDAVQSASPPPEVISSDAQTSSPSLGVISKNSTYVQHTSSSIQEHSPSSSTQESTQVSQQQQSPGQQPSSIGRLSPTGPPNPNPTTQESFFKSIHKRLQQLEANSTLSLQYIEEQSRILRDAFVKVEKRQLSKTETFLQTLNDTVMTELRGFRHQYDLLWQSTILELEGQREQHASEVFAISSRLSILADELVFQKRMAVVQSTLLLLCLGLVLFVKSGVAGGLEVPIYQQVSNLKEHWRSASPPMSPPQGWRQRLRATMSEVHLRRGTPTSSNAPTDDEAEHDAVRREELQSSPESDVGAGASVARPQTPEVNVEPPTPESSHEVYRESQSGPSTPRGSRDKMMWGTDEQSEELFSPVSEDGEKGHMHELTNGV